MVKPSHDSVKSSRKDRNRKSADKREGSRKNRDHDSHSDSDSCHSNSDNERDQTEDTDSESDDNDKSSDDELTQPGGTTTLLATPVKSPNDPNQYRAIRLSNGLTVVLISTVPNQTNKRIYKETPSQTLERESEKPSKRSRPLRPIQTTQPTTSTTEISLRQAIENRMLVFIDECLNLAPTNGQPPPADVSVFASTLHSVKSQLKDILAGFVRNLLDQLMPAEKPKSTAAVQVRGGHTQTPVTAQPPIDTQTTSLEAVKEILKQEIANLIEKGKKISPIGLILEIGQISLTGSLTSSVRLALLTHIGGLIAAYLQRKLSEAIRGPSADPKNDHDKEAPGGDTTQPQTQTDEESEEETEPAIGFCGSIFGGGSTRVHPRVHPLTGDSTNASDNSAEECTNMEHFKPYCWADFGLVHLDLSQNDSMMERKLNALESAAVSLTIPCGCIQGAENTPGISDLCRRLLSGNGHCYLHPSAIDNTMFTTFVHGSKLEKTKSLELKQSLKCVAKLLQQPPKIDESDIYPIIRTSDQGGARGFKKSLDKVNPLLKKKLLFLIYSLAKFDHPLRFLPPGCYEALRNTNLKEDELARLVHQFWCSHYRVENSTLAIKAEEPLEIIEKYVIRYFGKIDTRARPTCEPIVGECDPFDTSEFRRIVRIIPKSGQQHSMILTWALPAEFWMNLGGKGLDYITVVLSYHGPGSLYHSLQSRGLVNFMIADCPRTDYHRNDFCSLFQIYFELSGSGFAVIGTVIEEVFSYLKFMIPANPSVIRDIRISNAMFIGAVGTSYEQNFVPCPKLPPVARVSLALQRNYPGRSLFQNDDCTESMEDFGIEIQNCLEALTPQNLNILLSSKCFESMASFGTFFRTERYFGTRYYSEKIPDEWLTKWTNVEVNELFKYPPTNTFDSQSLIFPDIPAHRTEHHPPVEIEKTRRNIIWHSDDPRYGAMVYIHLNLSSPLPLEYISEVCRVLPKHCFFENGDYILTLLSSSVNLDLMTKVLTNQLADEIYLTKLWSGTFVVERISSGLTIKICCHKNKAAHLVNSTILKLKNLCEEFTEEEFQNLKQWAITDHQSQMHHSKIISDNMFDFLARRCIWSLSDIFTEIENCDLEKFVDFVHQFRLWSFLRALIVGNFNIDESHSLMACILGDLENEGCSLFHLDNSLLCWPAGTDMEVRVESFDPRGTKTLISKYFQLNLVDIQSKVIAGLVCDLMISVLLDKKSPGESWFPNYRMNIYLKEIQGMMFFQHDAIFVPNACCTVKHVDKLMENFIIDFYEKVLKRISNRNFDNFCDSGLKNLRNKTSVSYLQDELKCFSKEMTKFTIEGDRFNEELLVRDSVALKTVRKWYEENILVTDGACHPPSRLFVKVLPQTNSVQCGWSRMPNTPNLKTIKFQPLTREEERQEWSPEYTRGTFLRKIGEYKSSLLMYQPIIPRT